MQDCFPEALHRLFHVAGVVHVSAAEHPHQVVRTPELRRLRQQTGVGLESLILAPLHVEHQGQVAQRIMMLRLAGQRAAITGLGLGQLIALLVYVAEVVVRVGMPRHRTQCHADQPDAFLAAVALVAQHAEEVQRVRLSGLALQHLAVERLGHVQLIGPMRGDRFAQHDRDTLGERVRMTLVPASSGRSTLQVDPRHRSMRPPQTPAGDSSQSAYRVTAGTESAAPGTG